MQQRQMPSELYVHPSRGDDTAPGSSISPFKTLTRALRQAKPGMVIQLSRGTYSVESGEVFPLHVPAGVLVAGNVAAQGVGVIFEGGGSYHSPDFGLQNVTFVLEGDGQLRGVTITNRAAKGTGIWIESGTPTVAGCTLAQCSREGILATGSSDPLVSNCIFQGNGASGLTLVRSTRGEIRSNLMQQNRFGIAVSDQAAGLIVSNQIFDNRCGIVISGTASPILRGNILSRNQEDGLVVAGKANPDFGQSYDPAGNRISDNQRFDLRNATSLQLVSSGNQLNLARVSGAVQLVSTGSPTTAWLKQSVEQSVKQSGAVKPVDRAQSWLVMVQRLLDRGAVSLIDGSFQPEVTLAASEFAEWVQRAGLVGVNANVSPLTRLEAIRILVEAAGLKGGQPSLLNLYRDRAQIPTAQVLTVATAVRYRLVVAATPDHLNPLQLVSRAEAAAMLYQTLVAKGQVEPTAAGSLPDENVNPLPMAAPTRPPVVVIDPGHGGSDSGMATKVKTAEELMQEAGGMPPMLDAMQMPMVPMSPLPMGQFPSELPSLAGASMPGIGMPGTMPLGMPAGMPMSEMPPPGMPAEFLSMPDQLDQPEMPSLEEKTVVLSIAQAVAGFLQQQGVQVILTRADDRNLSLTERLAVAQQHQADAFVSIHANASLANQAEINGVETYHNPRSVEGARLAWAIHKALTRTADISDRGVHFATFPTLRQPAIPAAHIEVGYITGSQDAPSLANLAYHRYLARPIANAILRYLGQRR